MKKVDNSQYKAMEERKSEKKTMERRRGCFDWVTMCCLVFAIVICMLMLLCITLYNFLGRLKCCSFVVFMLQHV